MKYTTKLMATASLGVFMAMPVIEANAAVSELVVTARKREENIQDVPLSVAAFSGDMLANENINNIEDLAGLVAGFEMDRSFQRGFERPVIRGKSTILTGSAPGVSFFIDGVYFDGTIASVDLSSVERVEIVKGPQSALYGRNTYSGAINIVTKKPGDEFDLNASASIGEHGFKEFTAGVSGPLVEGKVAGGLFGRIYQYDGEYRNQNDGELVGGEETYSLSGTLNFTPNDAWEITARGLVQKDDDDPIAAAVTTNLENNYAFQNWINVDTSSPLNGVANDGQGGYFHYFQGELPSGRDINYDNSVAELFGDGGRETDRIGGSLSISWDATDSLKITSITGYEEIQFKQLQSSTYHPNGGYVGISLSDAIFTSSDVGLFVAGAVPVITADDGEIESFNQDLRFEYDDGGSMRFLGGLSYYKSKTSTTGLRNDVIIAANDAFIDTQIQAGLDFLGLSQCTAHPVCDPSTFTTVAFDVFRADSDILGPEDLIESEIENWGIYGRAEIDILDNLTFGVEARYAEDKLSSFRRDEDQTRSDPAERVRITDVSKTVDSFTPRFTLDYSVSDDNLLYAVLANGTKPGGFNTNDAGVFTGNTEYDEEEIWSLELGSKNIFADGQWILNVAGYYEQVTDYQLTESIPFIDPDLPSPGQNTGSIIGNKGEVEIWGLELETAYSPEAIEGLSLNLRYAYNNTEFTKGTDDNIGRLLELLDDGDFNCSNGDLTPLTDCGGFDALPVPTGDGSADVIPVSLEGNRTPLSAEHQLSLGFDYNRSISNSDLNWFIGATASYESEKYVQVVNLAEIPASTVVNFSTGLANENYRLSLWGKNIFDEDAMVSATRYFDTDVFKRAFMMTPRRGAQWGVKLDFDF